MPGCRPMTEPSLCAADTIAGRPMSVLGGK
jgi:hypothetical protein